MRLDHAHNKLEDAPMNYSAEFLQAALMEMNVREVKGKNHNPRILQYHKATSLKASADEVPWCASYMNFIIEEKCGVKGTNSAAARSFETWGKELQFPNPGCVVVLSRGSNPAYGHVGFYLYESNDKIYIVGGNQNNSVSIEGYKKSRLVSYRVSLHQ